MNFLTKKTPVCFSTMLQRRWVGILGLSLPWLLMLFLFIASGKCGPISSISHYYYTRVSGIFVSILGLLAFFLLTYRYRGKPLDNIISSIAGIFALCVVLFPTSNITDLCGDIDFKYSVTILKNSGLRENFHYISAAIFLACLAFMTLFLFTKTHKNRKKSRGKRIRNWIYILCGSLMIVALLVILGGAVIKSFKEFYNAHQLTFWMETLAVESFGVAWMIKGETLFRDRKKEEKPLISRIWHGYTTIENESVYENLLKSEILPGIEKKLNEKEGYHGMQLIRRKTENETEFVTIMYFDSVEAVKGFVGDDPEKAYVPDAARRVLLHFDERSKHYEIRRNTVHIPFV